MSTPSFVPDHKKWLEDTRQECERDLKRAELELKQAELDLKKAQVELSLRQAKLAHYIDLLDIEDAERQLAEQRRAAKEKAA